MKTITTLVAAMGLLLASNAAFANDTLSSPRKATTQTLYLLSNEASANEVLQVERTANGSFEQTGAFATGGAGLGRGLGSQSALIVADNGKWLFAVNAGSNDISAFAITRRGLRLVDRTASGGQQPISITHRNGLVYVVNAGAANNISGFRFIGNRLRPIAGSTQPLSSDQAGPAQIAFDPGSGNIVVTEKNTNRVLVYPVDVFGRAKAAIVYPSAGATPFGFAFASQSRWFGYDQDYLIVSEAAGGAAGASTTSSYELRGRRLRALTEAAATSQSAACWVAATPDGRYAYISNTGTDNITGYRVSSDGRLVLLDEDAIAATVGDAPTDSAISADGDALFVLNGGSDSISMFEIARDGSLTQMGELTGLPAPTVGLAAAR